MQYAPTLALYRVPNGLSADWQNVFGDLTALLHSVRCYLYDPGLAQGTEKMLHHACVGMDKAKERLKEAVARLYGIAPKTFDVGCGIQQATAVLASQFGNYRTWKKPTEPPANYSDRSAFFQFIRALHEKRETFPERQLLLELHDAILAEKGISLTKRSKGGRKPNSQKAAIVKRVRELKRQGDKWLNIYSKINAEFSTDYTYSRGGRLQKMLEEAKSQISDESDSV